ncbi:MAG TPA: hypothetical protein VM050_05895, partial [Patescibacteria group bacterium]|nr:hypothetical protein [Patescibacteria group bacterium]
MGSTGSRGLILGALMDGDPMSCRDIMEATGLGRSQVYGAISRCWRSGLVLRTEEAILEHERVFRGRRGVSRHLHPYHLYVLRPEGVDEASIDGRRFVCFSVDHLDPRGGGSFSKARRILGFLEENGDEAFFSTDVVKALSEYGVRVQDVMPNVRRFERQGLVYVRGYKTDDRQTPFKEGYLLTWIDREMHREDAIAEAVKRTDAALV